MTRFFLLLYVQIAPSHSRAHFALFMKSSIKFTLCYDFRVKEVNFKNELRGMEVE